MCREFTYRGTYPTTGPDAQSLPSHEAEPRGRPARRGVDQFLRSGRPSPESTSRLTRPGTWSSKRAGCGMSVAPSWRHLDFTRIPKRLRHICPFRKSFTSPRSRKSLTGNDWDWRRTCETDMLASGRREEAESAIPALHSFRSDQQLQQTGMLFMHMQQTQPAAHMEAMQSQQA